MTQRKLYLFTLHAHVDGKALDDYGVLFESISRLPVRDRSFATSSKLVALRRVSIDGRYVRLTAYEGPPGIEPLIFNLSQDEERLEPLGRGEVVATRTHAVVNLTNRDVVVEYNHRGAKASDIARAIEAAARRRIKWKSLVVEISPVPSPDFAKAVDGFEVIKLATVAINRPNLNWVHEKNHADAIAAESDAQRVELTAHAGREGGLAKRRGLVALIKGLGRESKSHVQNAWVVGRRPGETSDSRVSLQKHLEQRVARVELGPGGHPGSESVDAQIDAFVRSREVQLQRRGRNVHE